MAYCTSCGSPIPDGQGSSCSMCMGVMGWGNDGYYEEWARKQEQKYIEEKQAEEHQLQELMEEEALKEQRKEEEKEFLQEFYNYIQENEDGHFAAFAIDNFLEERHEVE